MRRFLRREAPPFLVEKGPRWVEQWRKQRERGAFQWYRHEAERANVLLMPLLLEQTQGRCAYCDHFPLGLEARPTIDHFRPKSREEFVELAFTWENLYGVCWFCNDRKNDQWDEALLRPDAADYDFFRYFDCDSLTGHLEPNPDATLEDQLRAQRTIAILGLNEGGRPAARARVARAPPPLEQRPYRFLHPEP